MKELAPSINSQREQRISLSCPTGGQGSNEFDSDTRTRDDTNLVGYLRSTLKSH